MRLEEVFVLFYFCTILQASQAQVGQWTKVGKQDGQWQTWTFWSTCSSTCFPATKTRRRRCRAPQFGGASCTGVNVDTIGCAEIVHLCEPGLFYMDPYDSSKPGGIGILSLTGPAGSITCPEISPVEDSREIGNQELAKRDGNPVACGGRTGNVVDKGCWEYDPSTNAWNSIDSLTEPKYSHSMVQLNENDFLVSGGIDGERKTTTEIYNGTSGTFSLGASLDTGRFRACLVKLEETGKIVSLGGFPTGTAVKSYSLKDNVWSDLTTMNTARIDLGCAAINGGSEILVAGGLEQDAVTSLKSVEIYNIESGQWRQAEDLPTGVRSFAVNNDGDIWGIGTRENQVYQYDGSVDAWRHLEHVQSPGHHSLTAWVMIDDQNKFGCKPV